MVDRAKMAGSRTDGTQYGEALPGWSRGAPRLSPVSPRPPRRVVSNRCQGVAVRSISPGQTLATDGYPSCAGMHPAPPGSPHEPPESIRALRHTARAVGPDAHPGGDWTRATCWSRPASRSPPWASGSPAAVSGLTGREMTRRTAAEDFDALVDRFRHPAADARSLLRCRRGWSTR